jgi:hypothetical protein
MYADDVSGPHRLEAQLLALRTQPDAVLVGSIFTCIDVNGRQVRPSSISNLHDLGSLNPPMAHGSVMFRREAFDRVGGYRADCDYWEDQEFFWRMMDAGALLVLREPHYAYRFNQGHSRLTAGFTKVENALDLSFRCQSLRRRGEDYNALIAATSVDRPVKVRPAVFRVIGSLLLMSGHRPRLTRRLLGRGRLRFDRETLAALVHAVASTVAPAAMRQLLNRRARLREARAARIIPDDAVFEWHPVAGLRAKG